MTQTASDLSPSAQTAITDALNQCVAETAVTTMLAQNFHWNVTGMAFGPLHALFQEIYEDHFVAQDDLAERIKALDAHAEGMLAGMLKRSKVGEHDGHADDKTMVKALHDRGLPVAYLEYPDEAHGFRRADAVRESLEGELYFFCRALGLPPPEGIDPIPIQNEDALG